MVIALRSFLNVGSLRSSLFIVYRPVHGGVIAFAEIGVASLVLTHVMMGRMLCIIIPSPRFSVSVLQEHPRYGVCEKGVTTYYNSF